MSIKSVDIDIATSSIIESDDDVGEDASSAAPTDVSTYVGHLRRRLERAIVAQRELLANNPAAGVPSPREPDTAGLMQCYHDVVVRGRHPDVPDLGDETAELHVAANLLANITLESQQMERLVDKIQNEITQLDDEYKERDDQIKELKEIMEKRNTTGDMAEETALDVKLKKTKQLFLSYRTAVDEMISECFADRDDRMKDILQDMCSSFFEGSDLYTAIRHDNVIIELLVDARVIIRHPEDKTLYRLNSEY